jgi:hypothetical protein
MPRRFLLWNGKLISLRQQTRRLLTRAKMTGEWDTYKEVLTSYNKEIRQTESLHGGGTARELRMF